MRSLIIGAALVALTTMLATGGSPNDAQAQTPLLPCFGAPADYVAANDSRDGAVDGKVSYPEQRVFLEAQGHVKPSDVTARHHMEHIHIGLCFPYAETWKQPMGARTVDVRYVFHHNENYTITKVTGLNVNKGGAGKDGFAATPAQIAELQAAMDASATSTRTVHQNYLMTGPFFAKCRKTFKLSVSTIETPGKVAAVDVWEPEFQATTYIDYGLATACTPEYATDRFLARDWVPTGPNMGYLYAGLMPPKASELAVGPVADPFPQTLIATGMDASLHVDPNYHGAMDDDGVWQHDFGPLGVVTFPYNVPTGNLAGGLHRLVFVGERHASGNEPNPQDRLKSHSALAVLPFTVAGGC